MKSVRRLGKSLPFQMLSACALLFILNCTGRVVTPLSPADKEQAKKINAQVFIEVTDNSTSSQPICAKTNSVSIQVSIPSDQTIYCRDNSQLMSSIPVGQSCSAGPVIKSFAVDAKPVDCRQLKVCGQAASQVTSVAERFDGTPVLSLTFNNLPWACQLSFDYSADPSFANFQTAASSVTPPVCRFCARTNSNSCDVCPALTSTEVIVAGELVSNACGASCKSCTVDGHTVPHGQPVTVYSRQLAKCGQPCQQVSTTRVCSDGKLLGDTNYPFAQCRDVLCDCTLPGIAGSFPSQGAPFTIYKGASSDCGTRCADSGQNLTVQCQSGTWLSNSFEPYSTDQISPFTSLTCSDSSCPAVKSAKAAFTFSSLVARGLATIKASTPGSCTVGATQVAAGQSLLFYSSGTGTCDNKCANRSRLRTCNAGSFEGDTTYAYSSCTDVACGCVLPTTGTKYDSGASVTLYKASGPSCGQTCADAGQSTNLTCQGGDWVNSTGAVVDVSVFSQFKFQTCSNPVCDCSRPNRLTITDDGKDHVVYSSDKPSCPKTCNDVKSTVKCTGGVLSGATTSAFDTCTDPKCSCIVPLTGGSILINEGVSVALGKVSSNSTADPNACSTASNFTTVTCTNGALTPTYDSTVFKYLKANCKSDTFSCTAGGRTLTNYGTTKIYKIANPGCTVACEGIEVYCQAGKLVRTTDYVTAVADADLVTYSAPTCQVKDCDCRANGYILPYKTSKDFFSKASGSCDPSACANAKTTLTCGDNQTISGGDPAQFPFDQCEVKACQCLLPTGGSLLNGAQGKIFATDKATCAQQNLCNDPTNFVNVSCNNGTLSSYDQNKYKFQACAPAICSCSANGVQIDFNKDVWFYRTATPAAGTSCGSVSAHFTCQAGGAVTGDNGEKLTDFTFKVCSSDTDQGTLGGTGGGTGNDEGPGSAIRKRNGAADSSGSWTPPCFEGVNCRAGEYLNVTGPQLIMKSCTLPWGGGEIELYGTVMAFDKACVSGTDRCSNHRQSRTCHIPTWTGSASFNYPTCVEKASCP